MWIIGEKLGEFQETLKVSQLEAKLIYLKYERSTTSRFDSATSAWGLVFYLFYICFYKTNVLFSMARLCFLYFFIYETIYDYDSLMLLPIYFKHPKMLKKFFSTKKK
jgi:hypothetical protein